MISSCGREEEAVVDCFAEGIKASLHYKASSTDPKQITLNVEYWGDKEVTSVKWSFGDGTTASTSSISTTHNYGSAGNYSATAEVSLNNGKCDLTTKKTVEVQ
ncbi:PKD domain-containing protein [Chryseobacterium sp. Ch-15]|uniref:PKD domain-containing protein n=1 Tax=Chryseobacterium muglaense TaxID=2893752 RepID=A0A9Q3UZV3_9FLAO|nr:PKD domain-containing protein [Chryseobacterium muglaense]MBD3905508.1 PKD domain-containing protein [Chryseobacterium muglaense]MCC9035016.1 PKD domain-containing protein [Chryseobacterium muglaense]MCC9037038.1 PKD domain-containing protein [Chryseobacterium muglaense]MCM2555589.1 PKD domain-containing protein [Chryseobacterium muglaense]